MKALITSTSRLKSEQYPIYLVAKLLGDAANQGYNIKELHACGGKAIAVAAKSYTTEPFPRPSFHHHPANQEESILPTIEILLAVWDGKSKHTGDLISQAKSLNLPTIITNPH